MEPPRPTLVLPPVGSISPTQEVAAFAAAIRNARTGAEMADLKLLALQRKQQWVQTAWNTQNERVAEVSTWMGYAYDRLAQAIEDTRGGWPQQAQGTIQAALSCAAKAEQAQTRTPYQVEIERRQTFTNINRLIREDTHGGHR